MPNIAEDREIHQINFPKGKYADLCNFRSTYGYPDNGIAVEALLNNYRQVLELRKKYEDKLLAMESKQREIEDYEQQLVRESGVSQGAFNVIQQVIEEDGVGAADLESACQLLRVSGVSLADLVESMARMGGMKNYMVTLTQAVQHLESEHQAIADRKAKQCADTTRSRIEMERLVIEQEKARQQIKAALEFAETVTRAYEGLNIVLGDVVGKVLAGGYSIMDLPAEVLDVLAGVIMMLRIDMCGDKEITFPVNPVLQRLSRAKADMSEIPRLLARAEHYVEFNRRLNMMVDGGNGESHLDDRHV